MRRVVAVITTVVALSVPATPALAAILSRGAAHNAVASYVRKVAAFAAKRLGDVIVVQTAITNCARFGPRAFGCRADMTSPMPTTASRLAARKWRRCWRVEAERPTYVSLPHKARSNAQTRRPVSSCSATSPRTR
jgi:hypothetical protein